MVYITFVLSLSFAFLQRPEGSSFLTDLKQKLVLPPNEANVAGTRYNVPLMNSLVLYIGIQVSIFFISCGGITSRDLLLLSTCS